MLRALAPLTTPLLPADYLALLDPLQGRALRARVEQVVPEAAGAVTLVLRPGAAWRGHRAGQWVRLGVQVDGAWHHRSYSLTAPPAPDGLLRVTVAPQPGGLVSTRLTGATRPGDVLRLDQAAGDFVLDHDGTGTPRPLLLVSAGSGLTPVMGLLRQVARDPATAPDTVVVHSARDAGSVLFGAELRALAARSPWLRLVERHTGRQGRLDADALAALVPDRAARTTYACGPAGLLDALEERWAADGLPLVVERFAPRVVPGADGADAATGGTVTLARSGAAGAAAPGTTVLDAGEAAGGLLPSGCRMGICFGCVVPLLSGAVRDVRSGECRTEAGELVQTCVTTPVGDVVLDA